MKVKIFSVFIFLLAVSPPAGYPEQRAIINLSDFEFINQDGRSVSLGELDRQVILLSFIYTRCPMPSMCPLLTSKMSGIQKMINQTDQKNVILLSISFDPEYDTPRVLREYGERYGADFSNWHFLTGDSRQIEELGQQVDLFYEDSGDGTIGHNMKTLILAPGGKIQQLYHGSGWQTDEVYQALLKLARYQRNE